MKMIIIDKNTIISKTVYYIYFKLNRNQSFLYHIFNVFLTTYIIYAFDALIF